MVTHNLTFTAQGGLHFLHLLSDEMAERSKKLLQDIKVDSFTLKNLGQVKDKAFLIAKERFFNIAESKAKEAKFQIDKEKVWEKIDQQSGRSWLEIFINVEMRKLGSTYDVVFNKPNDPEYLRLNFRESAHFITQRPISFCPVFEGPFDQLHEVIQGQYAITHANDAKPVLASWHFACCVGFAAFHQKHQIGVLAHLDTIALADLSTLLEEIKKAIPQDNTETSTTIEYALIGGCADNAFFYTSLDPREYIKKLAQSASDSRITFKCVKEIGDKISEIAFKRDPVWTESVRLNRSIALDTRQKTLDQALMSYEPELNPFSSFHERQFTRKESDEFEKKRKKGPAFVCSYLCSAT